MSSVLTSPRLNLRRITEGDFDCLRVFESNQSIMRFTSTGVAQTEEQTRVRLSTQISKQAERDPFGVWFADLKDGAPGVAWFMLMPTEPGVLELGFMVAEPHWRKGFAAEGCEVLIAFVRTEPQIKKLIACTNRDNFPSKRTLAKLGFKALGVKDELDRFELDLINRS